MRALGWFWAALLLICGIGAGVLQWLGPPEPAAQAATTAPTALASLPPPGGAVTAIAPPLQRPAATGAALQAAPAPITPPDPALLEPAAAAIGGMLPRIGEDGRMPMQVYAAAFDPQERRPLVAILLAGIGMSQTDSNAAIAVTPAAVSLAVTPYAIKPEDLLTQARAHGHEFFVSIPMEPRAYPLDDPGNRALLTGNTQGLNDQRLAWSLSRITGYVGATGALGALRGERFADSTVQFEPVLTELHKRGVLYVDPRPWGELPPSTVGRPVDVMVDETPSAEDIDAKLAKLEEVAQHQGSAIGLVSLPRPVTLQRLAAWASGLSQRGLVLAPVSAVTKTPLRPAPSQQAGTQPAPAPPATP